MQAASPVHSLDDNTTLKMLSMVVLHGAESCQSRFGNQHEKAAVSSLQIVEMNISGHGSDTQLQTRFFHFAAMRLLLSGGRQPITFPLQ